MFIPLETNREPWMTLKSGGLAIRQYKGKKGPKDVRVTVESDGEVNVVYEALGIIFKILYENEERLYPQSDGCKGGEKLFDYLRDCVDHGWMAARVIHDL